jgi:hypothetical protein
MVEIEVKVKGPGAGREQAILNLQNAGLKSHRHRGRHAAAAQRLPTAEEAASLRALYCRSRCSDPCAGVDESDAPATRRLNNNNYPAPPDEVEVQMVPNGRDGNFPRFGRAQEEQHHENSLARSGTAVARRARRAGFDRYVRQVHRRALRARLRHHRRQQPAAHPALSSLEGAAVTHIRLKGAEHEFSSLHGVMEDVTDIILNVKSLIVKLDADEPRR